MSRWPHQTAPQVSDSETQAVLRQHDESIKQLQVAPGFGMRVVQDVRLTDGDIIPVAHRLGRLPLMAWTSAIRGAVSTGRIEEIRDGGHDRKKVVALKASGWGATITVDVGLL